jgi:hypothetical protein
MSKSIDELVELIQAGDEDAAGELKSLLGSKDREAAVAKRDLRLKTDATLRERYPRALRAFDKGKLKLADDLDESALVEALRESENDLAELGVPIDLNPVPQTPSEVVGEMAVETDPAKALSGGRAASSPGGAPRDIVSEYFEALKGSTRHDEAKAASLLVELNKSGQMDKIAQITEALSARPITNRFT